MAKNGVRKVERSAVRVPRVWPGFLAVWVAIVLHMTWVALLVLPESAAENATPVHEVVSLSGGRFEAAVLFGAVATFALAGTIVSRDALEKIFYVLPQQLVLGISAAGALIAMYHSHYADGVPRPATFIIADQLAILLTWAFHTIAILFLFLIHQGRMTPGGRGLE